MKTAIVLYAIVSAFFLIGYCNAEDETQTVEPTTAVAEATSSGDLDLTMQDICKAIFCRFVIRDNGTRKYKGKCSRMPKDFKSTCRKCRATTCKNLLPSA